MDVPPSRYKVVEEGRRLVVRDTWNGNAPVTGHMPQPKLPSDSGRPATVEQARAALHKDRPRPAAAPDPTVFILTTHPWFDDRAPRQIRVEGKGQGALLVAIMVIGMLTVLAFVTIGWIMLLVAGFFLIQAKVRNAVRAGLTLLLDELGESVEH